jgi:hypothetical protein
MTKLFFSYSHVDENFRDTLEKHLSALKHEGLIDSWHDRKIRAGDEFDNVIDENLKQADVILLLISSDFIASRYCFEIEMKRALETSCRGNCSRHSYHPAALRLENNAIRKAYGSTHRRQANQGVGRH